MKEKSLECTDRKELSIFLSWNFPMEGTFTFCLLELSQWKELLNSNLVELTYTKVPPKFWNVPPLLPPNVWISVINECNRDEKMWLPPSQVKQMLDFFCKSSLIEDFFILKPFLIFQALILDI